ncbi:MAG: hydrogenobyrinic acid a,c-diamide synthase (glutamine-hydrolyzing) [Chloroflexi bacterium]|nr:hydrogenobyrinic acid a,c-diamide synthase (glutamine-hydrolyzing) [Chloroflexota bacterium]
MNGNRPVEGAIPRVVIAAPQGRSGKTIVSLALCAAFRRSGLAVQPFKKGPDYIDPSWLTAAAGRTCRNLDPILMPEKTLLGSFRRAGAGADLAVIEGAMGLYDGLEGGGQGSTAHVAGLLRSPVLLVVNAARMTQSAAAMVLGYQRFDPECRIAGVILNNVAGSRHEAKLTAAIEKHCGIPVAGCVSRDSALNIGERHLGLVPYREAGDTTLLAGISDRLRSSFDLDGILAIARAAPALAGDSPVPPRRPPGAARIGIIYDNVFTFYYPENLEALVEAGAGLVYIDSLKSDELPAVDGLYIGGGFPEMFLESLEANARLRQSIARAVEDGLPVYAECAGLMFLCRSIIRQGKRYRMAGVIPADVELCGRQQGHGYVAAEVVADNPLFPVGRTFRGHEFHYSRLTWVSGLKCAYHLRRGRGIGDGRDGVVYRNVLAAYTHLHALGSPDWAAALVDLARHGRRSELALAPQA